MRHLKVILLHCRLVYSAGTSATPDNAGQMWGEMVAPEVLLLAAEFTAFQNPVERGSYLPPVEQNVCLSTCCSLAALLAVSFAAVYSRFAMVQLEAWFVFLKGTLLKTL